SPAGLARGSPAGRVKPGHDEEEGDATRSDADLMRGACGHRLMLPQEGADMAHRFLKMLLGVFPGVNGRFAAPALTQFVREESVPGGHVQSDDELLDYARRNGSTCYHASCTCMMGTHPMSVVDSELRVHGIDGLRVIDASVMPAVTSTNTNPPTIMIAEKGAAMIKGAARRRMAA